MQLLWCCRGCMGVCAWGWPAGWLGVLLWGVAACIALPLKLKLPFKLPALSTPPSPSPTHCSLQVEDCEFEEGEVYAIDIIMSTGEGKPK